METAAVSGVWSGLLDRSIVLSFDRTGYQRHARAFRSADLDVRLEGRTCLVTGATSGLGLEVARGLASRGARVHLLCRDRARGEAVRARLFEETGSTTLEVGVVDLADLDSVRRYASAYAGAPIDVLVQNAGVLPLARALTGDGLELAVATNLVGPFLLTRLLWAKLRRPGARLIHVSSGGMYSERLDVDALLRVPSTAEKYDGVKAYARTKRAQVVLSELLAVRAADVAVSSMHPGWADTPGVSTSLPGFHTIMRWLLRTPAQGADTIVWLAAADAAAHPDGRFFFDRAPAAPHLFSRTRESPEERTRLWNELCRLVGADPSEDFR